MDDTAVRLSLEGTRHLGVKLRHLGIARNVFQPKQEIGVKRKEAG